MTVTRVAGLASSLLCATGCIVTRNVGEKGLRGGYVTGDSYEVVSDVAVTEFGLLSPLRTDINLMRSVISGTEGIMASGTVMRIERVLYRRHPENGASLHPMAVVQSGRWQGREVDLRHLSTKVREAGEDPYAFYILEPDATWLRKVPAPKAAPVGAAKPGGCVP